MANSVVRSRVLSENKSQSPFPMVLFPVDSELRSRSLPRRAKSCQREKAGDVRMTGELSTHRPHDLLPSISSVRTPSSLEGG